MTLILPSSWKAYWVQESVAGTTPSNPSFVFMGYVDSGTPTPNPNYKQVRASGSPDFYINQRMSVKPEAKLSLIPNKVSFLTTLLSANASPWGTPFSLVLRDATDSLYIRLLGAYIDRARVRCAIEDQVKVDLDLVGMTTDVTAPTLGSGSYAADPSGTDVDPIYYRYVTVSKDGSALTDWTDVEFEVNKNFIRRLTPSTGATRALETVARDHHLMVTRDMDSGTALDEYSDIANDTTRTMKLKLTNVDNSASWSVTINSAKTSGLSLDPMKPEDIVSKQMTYMGSSLTFGTS